MLVRNQQAPQTQIDDEEPPSLLMLDVKELRRKERARDTATTSEGRVMNNSLVVDEHVVLMPHSGTTSADSQTRLANSMALLAPIEFEWQPV